MRAILPGAAIAAAVAAMIDTPTISPARDAPKPRQAPARYAPVWWNGRLYPAHKSRPLSDPMTDADYRALAAAEAKRERRRLRNLAQGGS
jgi:hypothetical protein